MTKFITRRETQRIAASAAAYVDSYREALERVENFPLASDEGKSYTQQAHIRQLHAVLGTMQDADYAEMMFPVGKHVGSDLFFQFHRLMDERHARDKNTVIGRTLPNNFSFDMADTWGLPGTHGFRLKPIAVVSRKHETKDRNHAEEAAVSLHVSHITSHDVLLRNIHTISETLSATAEFQKLKKAEISTILDRISQYYVVWYMALAHDAGESISYTGDTPFEWRQPLFEGSFAGQQETRKDELRRLLYTVADAYVPLGTWRGTYRDTIWEALKTVERLNDSLTRL